MTPSAEENAATRRVIDVIVGMPPVIAASALTRALATMIRESPLEPELKVEMARNLASALIALVEIKAPEQPEWPPPVRIDTAAEGWRSMRKARRLPAGTAADRVP